MDRIQEALKKAEEKRRTTPKGGGRASHARPTDHVEQEDHSSIEYSNTRSISVSPKEMLDNRLVAGIKGHPQSDIFRILRTKVLHRIRKDGINTIAVTSP